MKLASQSDEVDRLVAEWQRERPDVDTAPLQVLSRVTRLARHLDRERRTAFAAHELEHWSFDVLAALRRAGAPYELTPGSLLRRTLVTSGAMTNRLDRLEDAGFVQRLPDPVDRRGVLVRLTPAGKRRVDACLADLVGREWQFLAPLDAEDQRLLADLLRRMLVDFDRSE
jgi:DNA-binding MarR family transcriptional regulator